MLLPDTGAHLSDGYKVNVVVSCLVARDAQARPDICVQVELLSKS